MSSIKSRADDMVIEADGAYAVSIMVDGVEVLSFGGPLGDYADDAAAGSGGVPVNGVYRNGSALMIRVA